MRVLSEVVYIYAHALLRQMFAIRCCVLEQHCWHSVSRQKSHMPGSSSFTHRDINSSVAAPKPLANQLGYWV